MKVSDSLFPFSDVSNSEFGRLFVNTRNVIDCDIICNDKKLNDNEDDTMFESDFIENIDPDTNFLAFDNSNKYWLPEEFNSKNNVHNDSLSLLHFNSRSLYRNFDDINEFISQLDKKFSVYGFSETWIHSKTPLSLFHIDDFTFFHNDRIKSKGGGVAMFIHNSLNVSPRSDLTLSTDLCESLFMEINITGRKNIIVAVIYRDPKTSIIDFNIMFNDCLEKLKDENKDVYIMGDFNVNLMNYSSIDHINEFVNTVYNNSFRPLIDKPTRISKFSSTLIDNILTNVCTNEITSGLFYNDITDHLPIFSVTKNIIKTPFMSSQTKYTTNLLNQNTIDSLNKELAQFEWKNTFSSDNVDAAYDIFLSQFTEIFESNCKVKPKSKKKKKNIPHKPWITPSLLRCINKKNKLYKIFCLKRNSKDELRFKKYRNKLNKILKLARKQYFSELLHAHKNNLIKVWDIINNLLGKKSKDNFPAFFKKNDNKIVNDQDIANEFNDFFSNIASIALSKLSKFTNTHFSSYLHKSCEASVYFNPTNELEIINIVKQLKNSNSTGFDGVSTSLMKKVIHTVVLPLVHIFNLSLCSGKVPKNLKIGKIIPVFKKGDKHSFANYRPITILPCFSKVLEKIVYNRMTSHLEKYELLNNNQYGFRARHSCEHALIDLHDKLLNNINNNLHSFGIFLDLSKAFDLINHDILLYKLPFFGIRGTAWDWFFSYLNDRKQFTVYKNSNSTYSTTQCGVPQGSILGPLLFLLYINDLCYVSSFFKLVLFADDTNIIASHVDFEYLVLKTNNELDKVTAWFDANRLIINYDKTNIMYFRKPCISHDPKEIRIKMNDVYLNVSTSLKFLGIVLDDKLTFDDHRLIIRSKISKNIGILCKLRTILPERHLFMLYNSLILPYIQYCNITWASVGISKIEPIHILQKKALRICTNSAYLAPSSPIFFRLKTLTVYDIHQLKIAILMYYVKNGLAPNNISSLFQTNNDVHQYNTRSSEKFHYPIANSRSVLQSVKHTGPRIWNSLLNDTSSSSTISSFKLKLKKLFIDAYNENS